MAEPGVLVIDVGGNNVKLYHDASGATVRFPSGRDLTPEKLVAGVAEATSGWRFDRVTVGCPGPVKDDRLVVEPHNLGPGWTAFELAKAFHVPAQLVNDAVMQAIGSYEGGKMLFLGLGTGLGAALVAEGAAIPLEVAHLPYRKNRTFEDCVGQRGYARMKRKRWEDAVHDVAARLKAAFVADYVVLGGGNAKRLKTLPPDCRLGSNANAFKGGVRLWTDAVRIF